MRDRMNDLHNISPDQRSFLALIQDQPDTLDRVVKQINVVSWRLSAWMRRERFRKALAAIVKSLRARRRLELELAATAAVTKISRLVAGEEGTPLQLDSARTAVELCFKNLY